MRSTIALNGPYFNTQRMLEQYVLKAYFHGRLPVLVPALEVVLAH
jgi:glycogen phosphorylase